MNLLRSASFFLFLGVILAQDTWSSWLNQGIRAFNNGQYCEAGIAFQKSVDLNRSAVEPRLYLGSAWMRQYIPGAASPENLEIASNAERAFLEVLNLEPKNVPALDALASLAYLQSMGTQSEEEKLKLLEAARGWYLKVVDVEPARKDAHYALGVIGWASWYPGWNAARSKLGMRPEEPGPLVDAATRAELRARYGATLQDAIDHLNLALALDPQYDDAMAYMNLIVRESADLCDSTSEYATRSLEADAWIQKALDTRKEKNAAGGIQTTGAWGGAGGGGGGSPLAPTSGNESESATPPNRIFVRESDMQLRLTSQTHPVYPPVARQARIEGDVVLKAVIGKDGRVLTVDLESGHPLLAGAAMDAVRQWKYTPLRLNGDLIQVITSIRMRFRLDETKPEADGSTTVRIVR